MLVILEKWLVVERFRGAFYQRPFYVCEMHGLLDKGM